jgi:hypothetical protein
MSTPTSRTAASVALEMIVPPRPAAFHASHRQRSVHLGGVKVSTMYTPLNQYHVVMESIRDTGGSSGLKYVYVQPKW